MGAGVPNKFGIPMVGVYSVFNVVQFSNGRLNGSHFVRFSIGLDHSKTKLLASLDHFIDK